MPMDGTSCQIFLYPDDGFTEMDLRIALTGRPDDPPWPLPEIDPEDLPTETPEEIPPPPFDLHCEHDPVKVCAVCHALGPEEDR